MRWQHSADADPLDSGVPAKPAVTWDRAGDLALLPASPQAGSTPARAEALAI